MKVRKMLVMAAFAILFLAANISFAQVSHKEGDCSKNCQKECGMTQEKSNCTNECTSKTGNSQGTMDSVKVCPVSGEKLDGSEGEPVKFTYLGKVYEFCCNGCVKKFKAEPMNYIKTELTCPVMGETADKNVSTVVDGVKYYFCCSGCIKKFEKDPKKYLDNIK